MIMLSPLRSAIRDNGGMWVFQIRKNHEACRLVVAVVMESLHIISGWFPEAFILGSGYFG